MDLCITGLIRHGDKTAIKNLRRMEKSLKPKNFFLLYWKYPEQSKIPTTNPSAPTLNVNKDFLENVSKSTKAIVIAKEPVNIQDSLYWVHPQVETLQLIPNPLATFSWLSALENASRQLSERKKSDELWLITRPDFYTSRYFLYLTRKCFEKCHPGEKVIYLAKRPNAHNVFNTAFGSANLPIDHFYIGFGISSNVFVGISDMFREAIRGNDKRQPLVNEFLIAQFLKDQGMSSVQFPLPYLLRRGSWRASLVPNGKNKTRKFIATVRYIQFLIELIVELHIVALFPKLLNKNLI